MGHALEGHRGGGTIARAAGIAARILTTLAGAALAGWAVVADAHWAERHVLADACATSGAEWIAARALPWIAGALGLTAVWKLAPALASRVERFHFRARAGPLAGIVVAVAAALGVGEVIARSMHDRVALGGRGPLPGGREAPMTRADPRLGWVYHPGRTTFTRVGDRVVAYAIDRDGHRASSSDHRADPGRPTVLFAGESIAFGYGLPYEETFPSLVGRDLGVQAVNLAVVGYGNDQAHLRVLDALPRFARPLAVVTVFIPGQMERNVESWRPRLDLGPDGALVPVPASSGPRLARLLRELPLRGDARLRITAAILRATAEAARAHGAFPLFVVTNYGPPCLHEGGEAWIVEELFVRQGLPFVRVDLDREDVLPGAFERHPAGPGARKIARAVELALSGPLGLRVAEAAIP
ncbi:MAG TPA: hypothetical protein VIW03_03670 [Anaeromyxobacter sp.]